MRAANEIIETAYRNVLDRLTQECKSKDKYIKRMKNSKKGK